MKIELVDMTPAHAAKLLEGNSKNRNISPRRVDALAAQIERGEWLLDGSPVRVAESGRLLDGQHRLQAIVQSGITVRMYLASGVEERAQLVIDTGKPRTFSDYLRLRGETAVAASASVTRLLLNYETGNLAKSTFRLFFPSTAQLWSFFDEGRERIAEGVSHATTTRRHVSLALSTLATAYVVLSAISRDDVDEMYAELSKDKPATQPVMLLSRWADNRGTASTGIVEQRLQMIYIIKAWNLFRSGDEGIAHLRWSRAEVFPEPK